MTRFCRPAFVNVLDPQAEALHQAEAGAVEELGHQFMNAAHLVDEVQDLFAGEDSGEAFGAFGGGREDDGIQVFVEDFAVEEKESAESLILRGGRDISLLGEVGQEGLDFGGAQFGGVTLVVEKDKAADPIHVSFLGAIGVMLDAQGITYLIEQFFRHRD